MPVRNPAKAGKPGTYPVSMGSPFGKPEHNPKPTTTRGKRRSQRTPEYEKNLSNRQSQSGQHGKTVQVKRGPTKIPQAGNRGSLRGEGTCRYDHQKYIVDFAR